MQRHVLCGRGLYVSNHSLRILKILLGGVQGFWAAPPLPGYVTACKHKKIAKHRKQLPNGTVNQPRIHKVLQNSTNVFTKQIHLLSSVFCWRAQLWNWAFFKSHILAGLPRPGFPWHGYRRSEATLIKKSIRGSTPKMFTINQRMFCFVLIL